MQLVVFACNVELLLLIVMSSLCLQVSVVYHRVRLHRIVVIVQLVV